jgi:pSer/pThr/pTyr-binding forkhead associated (FHA) protein
VDPLLIALLKYGFLVLLFLFVFWAIRTVAVTLRVPKGDTGDGRQRTKPRRGSNAPAVVLVRTNGKRGGSHRLAGPMQIGRAESCEIQPKDDYLSQFHARLFSRDGLWYVEDLGSTNGTFLNDHKVAGPLEVHAGDDVRLGRTVLQLRR